MGSLEPDRTSRAGLGAVAAAAGRAPRPETDGRTDGWTPATLPPAPAEGL